MKRAFLVLLVVVAVFMLFAATKVGADGTGSCISSPDSRSFDCRGYHVETVPRIGDFPVIRNTGTATNPVFQSVFQYNITPIIGQKPNPVNWVDILIPTCTPGLNPISSSSNCTPQTCYTNMFTGGSGDPLSGFGLGLITENTWKWDWTLSSKLKGVTSGTVTLTLPGIVYAATGTMFLKLNLLSFNYPFGQILAPSCSQTTATNSPAVPQTLQREETIDGLAVCIQSSDGSGCPTSVSNCENGTGSPCVCTGGTLVPWDKLSNSDISIVSTEQIEQVWTDSDTRCQLTYMITGPTLQLGSPITPSSTITLEPLAVPACSTYSCATCPLTRLSSPCHKAYVGAGGYQSCKCY